ncbi:MAG: GerMN domain-containing protein [Fimbriimonadaceae bacterium]|nr:GerMN domain-containing protein [Fimbriimonadaceae bacterium]
MASKTKSLWLFLAGSGLLVAALAAYVRFSPAREVPPDMRRPSTASQDGTKAPATPTKVIVFTPHFQDNDLKFDEIEETLPQGEDKVLFAVNGYLSKLDFLPKGATLKTAKVIDGLAELDFDETFNTTYGTDDERTIVNGILTAVGQFPEIRSVRFLAGGKPIESLGNIELTDPQPVLRP